MKRGFNISSWVDPYTAESWIRQAVEHGANFFRYGFVVDDLKKLYDLKAFESWIDQKIEEMLLLDHRTSDLNIKFMIDLHSPLGGLEQFNHRRLSEQFWFVRGIQNEWLSTLSRLARSVKGNKAFWGIEPCNEPSPPNRKIQKQVMQKAQRVVREVNPDLWFVVPSKHVGPKEIEVVPKIKGKKVAYTTHMYLPAKIQSAPHFDEVRIRKQAIFKKRLERIMQPAIDFRKEGNQLIIGETGAFPSLGEETQRRYIRNVLKICKQHKIGVCIYPFLDSQWGYEQAEILPTFGKVFGGRR